MKSVSRELFTVWSQECGVWSCCHAPRINKEGIPRLRLRVVSGDFLLTGFV